MDKISVLMAVYKEPLEWVRDALISIKSQKNDGNFAIEIVLVLDEPTREKELHDLLLECNSTGDNSYTFVFIRNIQNIGHAESLNKAFTASSGNYIARLDSDDICYPERFIKQYAYLKENRDVNFVGAAITRFEASGSILNDVFASNDLKFLKIKAFYSCVAYHSTWFMRRKAFLAVGGYLPYPNALDFDFLLRMFENGIDVHNIQEPLVHYRVHTSSLSNKYELRQRKCKYHSIKQYKLRQKNPHHKFDIEDMRQSIAISYLTEKSYALSQKLFNEAMRYRLKGSLTTTVFFLLISMMLSPWQAKHVYLQAKSKLLWRFNKSKYNNKPRSETL